MHTSYSERSTYWAWKFRRDGSFSAKSNHPKLLSRDGYDSILTGLISLDTNKGVVFTWRQRGSNTDSWGLEKKGKRTTYLQWCFMCKCSSEDVDLLLLLYLVVTCLWCEILRWLGLHRAMPGTMMEQVPLKKN